MNILNSDIEHAESLSLKQLGWVLLVSFFCNYFEVLILPVWLIVCFITIRGYFKGRMDWVWYCIAASPGLEVWGRMSRAPGVPMEMGKYFLVMAIGVLIVHKLRNPSYYSAHYAGKVLLIALLPAVFVSLAYFDFDAWVFNGLGILELLVLLALASEERWGAERFAKTLQYALLPLIPILVFTTLKVPTYDDLKFSLSANSTGGFGSNQVSTIMGVGIVLSTLLIILKRPLIAIRPLNYALIGYLLFKGLFTFSRGGIIVAAVAVVIALMPNMVANYRAFVKYTVTFMALALIGYGVFSVANEISGNQLLLRYQGETAGTLDRTKEKNLNTITSGRLGILMSDFMMFQDNPFFGVGIGRSKDERVTYGMDAIAPHTEFTRLLSENGIGGLIVVFGLLIFAASWTLKQRLNTWRGITAALFVLAIATTFHAAMRTNTSTVFYALASIPVYYLKGKNSED